MNSSRKTRKPDPECYINIEATIEITAMCWSMGIEPEVLDVFTQEVQYDDEE